jgi:uncharacterized protein (TIGR02646 family)
MIRIDRSAIPEPAVLGKPYTRGKKKGKTELDLVLAALAAHRAAGKPDAEFSYKFERYKEDEVKTALQALFGGKCAYCETFYSASQPMDVEHWRPKGEVHRDDGEKLKPGYYWLAASWQNLMPSCIDCNRAREQHDIAVGAKVTVGKANQFPLAPGKAHVLQHEPPPDLVAEGALLIDPCVDDPEAFFEYTEEGVIRPRGGLDDNDRSRAEASIRVYALNRSGLVAERREVIRRIDLRLVLIDRLADLRDELRDDRPELASVVEVVISIEADALLALKHPATPFAGLARFFLPD